MIVFFKERLVFLSVPKTGTTAYQHALKDRADMIIFDPPELKHAPVYRYNRFFHPMFTKACKADMELMAVMRDPISWLGSWFRYRQRPFVRGHANATHGLSFDDFVRAYCEDSPPAFARVGSQAKFLEPRPNGVQVKYLFPYEDPARLHEFLNDRLGISLETTQMNVSPAMDLPLSSDVETLLRDRRSEEFELYESIQ
jgi:hypothetical protein